MELRKIKLKKDKKTKDLYLDIKDLENMFDMRKVEYYHVKEKKDRVLVIKFYDKRKRRINLRSRG